MSKFESMSATQLARAIGKTRQTVHTWTRSGMPRNTDGSYALADVIGWMVDRETAMIDPGPNCDSPALERYRTARAGIAELDLKVKEGELVPAEDVQSAWTGRYVEIVSALGHLGRRLAGVLPGKDAEQVIKLVSQEVQVLQWAMARRSRYCETAAQEVEVLQAFEKAYLEFIYSGIGYGNAAGRTSLLDPSMEFETWRANYLKEKEAGQ